MIESFIETLFRPLDRGEIFIPNDGHVVFANARPGPTAVLGDREVRAWQPYRSWAIDAGIIEAAAGGQTLENAVASFGALPDLAEGAALALLPMRKERDLSLALAAQLWRGLKPGGVLIGAAENNAGARSYERAFDEAFGGVASLSKNKARAFWATKRTSNADAPDDWFRGLDVRTLESGYQTIAGVFSVDSADEASALLVSVFGDVGGDAGRKLGDVHDLGAGWGYIAAELKARGAESLTLWENDLLALQCARENVGDTADYRWADVARECEQTQADTVVMNPPFHTGRRTDIGLGRAFVGAAAGLLRPDGTLWMVANRHLPYENELAKRFSTVETVAESSAFKVLRARK
jgi:16S rRNA (guanine1207-N2)-methyltransferase